MAPRGSLAPIGAGDGLAARTPRVVVVIPAYNEATTIRPLVKRTLAVCRDVIVVDDGSTDGTRAKLAGLPVACLVHEANRGKAAALATGFRRALAQGADAVVTLDGDGQHRPEDVPRLVAAARLHPERLVIAARLVGRDRYPRARNAANAFADFWIGWAAGCALADSQSGQRLYPAALLRALEPRFGNTSRFAFESEAIIRAAALGCAPVAVPIAAIHHPAGRPSHFRPVLDIARITALVAGTLLRRGLHPLGLWRSLRGRPVIVAVPVASTRIEAARAPANVD